MKPVNQAWWRLNVRGKNRLVAGASLVGLAAIAFSGFASESLVPDGSKPSTSQREDQGSPQDAKKAPLDRSGGRRFGKASFYANFFAGKKMADGKIMDPQTNNAASRTLPLGTTARVTNLKTGQSAVVTIQDRGPYVDGRIVDLSPATAQKIGITRREGIAKVEVAPIALPMPDGRIKLGAAAMDPQLAINLGVGRGAVTGW
jgi:rare lipoprotein A